MRFSIPALTLSAVLATLLASPAGAKLPPLSDEAKAKAAETAAKSAWTDKVGAYQLCQAMNRAADHYRKALTAAGSESPAAVETPACADPGPLVAAPLPAKPLEAAGAHSGATMATTAPNSNATAAEILGHPKK